MSEQTKPAPHACGTGHCATGDCRTAATTPPHDDIVREFLKVEKMTPFDHTVRADELLGSAEQALGGNSVSRDVARTLAALAAAHYAAAQAKRGDPPLRW